MSGLRSTRSTRNALLAVPLVLGLVAVGAVPAAAAAAAAAVAGQPSRTAGASGAAHPGNSLICGGKGVDPDARVRHRTGTVIHAPLHTVWKLQTDVEDWPSWQTPVEAVDRLDHGPLRRGSAFRWTTPIPPNPSTPATSLEITSTVRQIERGACIRWTGPAVGEGLHIDGVHVWTFTKVRGGVRVTTEETHTGPQVDADVPTATRILAEGLEAWLHQLKSAAEARAHDGGSPGRPASS
ncbi:SRPBCC family protein [Streptomyces sp. NPDC091272]|uniref:SRPBCC family protein n=1 Tax=Streptomyces sp. NPDC091272 TaxID=3365981 RepID=UPI00381DAA69